MIDKQELIFQRNEEGNMIPQEVILEGIDGNPTIKVIPLTRGRLQELFQKAKTEDVAEKSNVDNEVIKSGLAEPKLTDVEIGDMKSQMATAVTQAILSVSLGISQKVIGERAKEVVANQEYLLKKK